MILTLDIEDIKSSTQDIAMLGQYGVNINQFVEEAKKVVDGVAQEVKVKLHLIRNRKGEMKVKLRGIDVCSLLKMEVVEGRIGRDSIYNIARLLEEDNDINVKLRCRHLTGTIRSMGIEVEGLSKEDESV